MEKVGEGVRSARCSLTQPWKMGELMGAVVWEEWREPRIGKSGAIELKQLSEHGIDVTLHFQKQTFPSSNNIKHIAGHFLQ